MFNPDALLTIWLATMFLNKSILIRRLTWLGRSMMACNACLGLLFVYLGACQVLTVEPDPHLMNVFRFVLGLAVTWVNFELLREARNRWTLRA